MQHFNPTAFASVSASDRKAVAVSAYEAACAYPDGADWRNVADLLRAAVPAAKARAASSGVPTWFADYDLPKQFKLDSMDVTFADGVMVRCNVATAKGKPPRIGHACRIAVAFYRAKVGQGPVPEMTDLRMVRTDEAFDAATCSRLTADLRANTPGAERWTPAPVPSVNGPAGETEVQRAERIFGGRWYQNAKGDVLRAHDAPGLVWDGEIEQFTPPAPVKAVEIVDEETAQAAWCEAVADAYGECEPFEIGGTDEPAECEGEAGIPATDEPTIIFAATIVGPEISVTPCESDAWEPTAETHPVLAYCNSRTAREKLFAAIQDGTFPAEIQDAKAGVFRLTLADARDCARIPRIKLVAPSSLAA